MNTRNQRRAAKIQATLGTIGITAGIAVGSPIAITCGLIALTIGAWALITSGHTLRWNNGIWTATCPHCPGTHTRGTLLNALRGARNHQHHEH